MSATTLATCTNCQDTAVDPAWPHAPCICAAGHALNAELHGEPCYGPCAGCPRVGAVYQHADGWFCEQCRARSVT